jgi:hypothetical protein
MSTLLDQLLDTFPANGDVGVPLQSNITITLSGLDYDTDSLKEGFFVEGPDTDLYIGPGLLELDYQGSINDFLESPGYQGIVAGVVTVTGINSNTLITFNPDLPLGASTEYRANLTGVLNAILAEVDGFVTFSFTSGTGSIEEIPSNISTSVLSSAIAESQTVGLDDLNPLKVIKTSPQDFTVEHNPDTLNEIVVEFNKLLDPSSVADQVSVKTIPATDHPSAITKSQGDIITSLEVEGKKLKIKI